MNHTINRLIHFGLQNHLLENEDIDYTVNLLLDILQIDEFTYEQINEELEECSSILEDILNYAINKGLVEDTTTCKDLFDTRIMNCLLPRPSTLIKKMHSLYAISPKAMSDAYYRFSIATNYIRKSRTDQNIQWITPTKYGDLQITINLSKPEKDPRDIAKAKFIKASGYPQCLLCKENVGFAGNINKPARQNHRILPLKLTNEDYYMQYSPYVYYNEHCIIFNKEHKQMVINKATFAHLLDFLDYLPHYFAGSNADLPIVGGSILSHDHYQGGHHHFPIEDAKTIETYTFDAYKDVKVEIVEWPLSTIRLTSPTKNIIALADHILQTWINYSDEARDIIAFSNQRHNTITPISRKKDGQYQLDLVLRNNRCDDTHPLGIFHPHNEVHHIKKENIGLIEVMGLAILPARLKEEMKDMQAYLLNQPVEKEKIASHLTWLETIQNKHNYTKDNVENYLKEEIGLVFQQVLTHAGVFKNTPDGIAGFKQFMETVKKEMH